jgi:tetratricopeptide (TPR) repeat protein
MHSRKLLSITLSATASTCFVLSSANLLLFNSAAIAGTKIAAKPAAKVFKLKADVNANVKAEIIKADDLMGKGKFSEAADVYHQALNKDPKSLAGLLGYGFALAKQFKLDGANDQLDKALALDPGNPMALAGKAMIDYNRLQSSSLTIQRNRDSILQRAESEVKQGLAKDPGMPEAHYTLGSIYKEQGRMPEAVAEFQQSTKLDPTYSEAYAGLGLAQLNQGDAPASIESLKNAVKYNSGNSTAHYGLGKAYLKQGQVDDAIKELNTSLSQFPNSAPAHLSMGEAYSAQGNTVAGIREFQESIRIKPENLDSYLHIADIREARGDLEHSIAELRSALEMFPNSQDLHLRIGDESLQLEKLDDAMKDYKAVLDTNPQNSQAAKGLTRACYLKAGKAASGAYFTSNDFESASRYIDQAVTMNPNDMELRLAQAKLRIMSGATVDLASLGTPKNDGERIAYAEALLAQNKFKEEDDQMNAVIASASDAKQVFAVGDLALMIKDIPMAEAAYKKAATMPDGAERAKRGMEAIGRAKDTARQDLTLADDLARRKQLASAIDKYHAAIYDNPKLSDAHLNLAQTLEKLAPPTSKDLREAIAQYKAYTSLTPAMAPKDADKFAKKLDMLDKKAARLELKEKSVKSKI